MQCDQSFQRMQQLDQSKLFRLDTAAQQLHFSKLLHYPAHCMRQEHCEVISSFQCAQSWLHPCSCFALMGAMVQASAELQALTLSPRDVVPVSASSLPTSRSAPPTIQRKAPIKVTVHAQQADLQLVSKAPVSATAAFGWLAVYD